MVRTETTGSWHNTGYHGHFRSKSRSDFNCEYRHLAKPPPPSTFVTRITEPVVQHSFSKHDNRHSFKSDALYFEEGLGRRRFRCDTNRFRRNFLAWTPQKQELSKSGAKASVYKVDYRGVPSEPLRQQLVSRPKTSFDEGRPRTTTYRYSHGDDNPNKTTLNALSNLGLTTLQQTAAATTSSGNISGNGSSSHGHKVKASPVASQAVPVRSNSNSGGGGGGGLSSSLKLRTSSLAGSETVASCMSWYTPPRPRPIIPLATQTSVITSLPADQSAASTEQKSAPAPPCNHGNAQPVIMAQ